MSHWITQNGQTLPEKGYEQAFGVWSGQKFLPILNSSFGVTEKSLVLYKVRARCAVDHVITTCDMIQIMRSSHVARYGSCDML